jgi:hypothetical protein
VCSLKVLKNQGLKAIPNDENVKIKIMGNVSEIMYMQKVNRCDFPVVKIDKDTYRVKETGEIKEYEHIENRSQETESLRRTFKRIRELINTNFVGNKNELAFTITYDENMTDVKRLYNDFRKFMMRLKYKYEDVDYISVVEPQGRGAWHCHVLLRFNKMDKLYIPNKEIATMWGNGFVKVKAIKQNVDNLGAYLSAYLGDVEYNEENLKSAPMGQYGALNVIEKEVEGKPKKFIKGGRLYMYPPGMNIYRKSKGIREPEVHNFKYEKAKNIVGSATPNYTVTYDIIDDDGIKLNTIIYEQYNNKRKK